MHEQNGSPNSTDIKKRVRDIKYIFYDSWHNRPGIENSKIARTEQVKRIITLLGPIKSFGDYSQVLPALIVKIQEIKNSHSRLKGILNHICDQLFEGMCSIEMNPKTRQQYFEHKNREFMLFINVLSE